MEDWVGKGGGWDVYGQIGWYAQRNGNLTSLDHTDSKHGSKLVNRNFLGIFTYFKFCLFVYYKFIVLFKIEFKNSVNVIESITLPQIKISIKIISFENSINW